jgi:hypothetical protein
MCLVLEWSMGFLATYTRAITHERYIGALLTKVTQRVCVKDRNDDPERGEWMGANKNSSRRR